MNEFGNFEVSQVGEEGSLKRRMQKNCHQNEIVSINQNKIFTSLIGLVVENLILFHIILIFDCFRVVVLIGAV